MIGSSSTAATRMASATSNSTPLEPIGVGRVLCQRPRRRLGDVLVGGVDDLKRRGRAFVQRETSIAGTIARRRPHPTTSGRRPPLADAGDRRDPRILLGHRRQPAHQVAEVVGEVDVVALLVALPREVAVAAVGDLLRQIQPQRIGAEPARRHPTDRRSCRATCSCAGRRSSPSHGRTPAPAAPGRRSSAWPARPRCGTA